ncbi:MAG: hypothetical protein QXP53_00885 [Candidatus Pacearchaeota archaeon]
MVKEINISYNGKQFRIEQQKLDSIISLVSKKLRNSLFNWFDFSQTIQVTIENEKSNYYQQLAESIAYALENDYLEEFEVKKREKKTEENEKPFLVQIPWIKTIPPNNKFLIGKQST